MEKTVGCPIEILNGSKEEKIAYFENLTIDHTNLNTSYSATMDLVNNSKKGRVYLVYGPSGVGKSTLLIRVKETIMADNFELMNSNPGIISVVEFEVASEGSGKFNWKDFYRRFLKSIQEPLIDEKISTIQLLSKTPVKRVSPYLPDTSQELREALENALINRQVKVALLDEAQHFLKIPNHKSLYDHMDALKSLANLTGTIFILFGTYELIKFLDINGQITRRTNEIYFQRYDITRKKDRERFKKTVQTFQDHLPFKEEVNLIEIIDFLYERSIGCIGVLSEWLLICVQVAVKKGLDTITFELLSRYAPSTKKAYEMAKEAISEEKKLKKKDRSQSQLQDLLGMKNNLPDDSKSKKSKTTKTKKDVGKRSPHRDKVGK